MIPVDREGYFRVRVTEFGLREEKTGSIGVTLKVHLLEILEHGDDGPFWAAWHQYDMEAEGTIYIIKKDGTVNQGQAEALMKYAGWDGNFDSIASNTWEPKNFSCNIEADEYKDKRRFKVGFVNSWDYTPGVRSNVDAAKAKALQSRFGQSLRALAANIGRNGSSAPTSRPNPPPAPRQPQHQLNDPPPDDGNIPF